MATFDSALVNWLWVRSKGKITFLNGRQAFSSVLAFLQPRCDFIILFSHSGLLKDKLLAQHFSQIGLIVGAHSQSMIDSVLKINNSYIVQADGNGFRLGKAILHFDKRKLTGYENRLILLHDSIPNNPEIMQLI